MMKLVKSKLIFCQNCKQMRDFICPQHMKANIMPVLCRHLLGEITVN